MALLITLTSNAYILKLKEIGVLKTIFLKVMEIMDISLRKKILQAMKKLT